MQSTTKFPYVYLNCNNPESFPQHPQIVPPSSDAQWESCDLSVVFLKPRGFSKIPIGFLPAFDAFGVLIKGRFESYGSPVLSEKIWTTGPRLANNGRMVAIEAAMMPRFISSLFFS